mgnify:CR=1 FL=1
MKIDRLYAITVYLLNHGKTSSSVLARRFEVSVRTIQRDIDALCLAGIPVIADTGASGGYELTDTFSMERHAATKADYAHILTALRGLATATNDPKVSATLEKLSALSGPDESGIILDFSILREGEEHLLQTLQTAIRQKHAVSFSYTNAENVTRTHTVEPIAAVYRWYAWYLLAYSRVRGDYRTYKLVRMHDLEITDSTFTREHDNADVILHTIDQKDPRPVTTVKARCKAEAKARAIEYLSGVITEELENGDALMTLHVIESEAFWLSMLLSLGDSVEVLEPEHIRHRILTAAEGLVKLYQKL